MCDDYGVDDYEHPVRQTYRWQRSKKDRKCYGCECTIKRGDLYHYTATLSDGSWSTWQHCARCWAILDHLWETGRSALHIGLDCEVKYDAPEDDPGHALAFMTPAEAQAWASKQPREHHCGGSWVDA